MLAIGAGAVQEADGVSFEFDDELGNNVFDGLLAGGDLDAAVVFACAEFTLHENVCAFDEAIGHLLEPFAEGDYVVPLGPVFPFVVFVFPGLLGGDAEFEDGRAIWQVLRFGVFADKSDDRELIEVHGVFFFLPCLLGH